MNEVVQSFDGPNGERVEAAQVWERTAERVYDWLVILRCMDVRIDYSTMEISAYGVHARRGDWIINHGRRTQSVFEQYRFTVTDGETFERDYTLRP
ncbi:hypothetical protein [Williamsia sp. DF01-3]|uniref:hypothetical protein n=1 Tax=Williamsia sp. DF01-3 TaxID=2934157 RepID=UPI001FF3C00C|nr:hypothetical protein [Williamsia sp. DF01-3]MCK0517848.1 hypothetical protein [Williamsia sp. DF01-3]